MNTMTMMRSVAKAFAIGALQFACSLDMSPSPAGPGGHGGAGAGPGAGWAGAPDPSEGEPWSTKCPDGDWECEGRRAQLCPFEAREWTCSTTKDGDCIWSSKCPDGCEWACVPQEGGGCEWEGGCPE